MKKSSEELINELQAGVRQLLLKAEKLKAEPINLLQLQPAEGHWSVAQILAHLNSYGRFYLPAIETSMNAADHPPSEKFHSGWFGNYFTKIMQPGAGGKIPKKMKSPRNHQPLLTVNAHEVINEFIIQQQQLLTLLDACRQKNLEKTKVPISISKMIRLKLGDTFRFLIAHEERHFGQIARTFKAVQGSMPLFDDQ